MIFVMFHGQYKCLLNESEFILLQQRISKLLLFKFYQEIQNEQNYIKKPLNDSFVHTLFTKSMNVCISMNISKIQSMNEVMMFMLLYLNYIKFVLVIHDVNKYIKEKSYIVY